MKAVTILWYSLNVSPIFLSLALTHWSLCKKASGLSWQISTEMMKLGGNNLFSNEVLILCINHSLKCPSQMFLTETNYCQPTVLAFGFCKTPDEASIFTIIKKKGKKERELFVIIHSSFVKPSSFSPFQNNHKKVDFWLHELYSSILYLSLTKFHTELYPQSIAVPIRFQQRSNRSKGSEIRLPWPRGWGDRRSLRRRCWVPASGPWSLS